MLTKRASEYLNSLQRETPIPTADIERKIVEQGYPAFSEWLAFHDRFAGYWEDLGAGDVAVWGLARKDGVWLGPEEISVYVHQSQPIYIACADAHPSHGFDLKPDGTFLGASMKSESFEIKVERTALHSEFASTGRVRVVHSTRELPSATMDSLLAEMQPYAVPEASDKYTAYYLSSTKLVSVGLAKPHVRVLQRED